MREYLVVRLQIFRFFRKCTYLILYFELFFQWPFCVAFCPMFIEPRFTYVPLDITNEWFDTILSVRPLEKEKGISAVKSSTFQTMSMCLGFYGWYPLPPQTECIVGFYDFFIVAGAHMPHSRNYIRHSQRASFLMAGNVAFPGSCEALSTSTHTLYTHFLSRVLS